MTQAIHEIRARIAALHDEQRGIALTGRNRGEVVALINQAVDAWQDGAARMLTLQIDKAAAGQPFAPYAVTIGGKAIDLGPILVSLMGAEPVRRKLHASAQSLPVGLSHAERVDRLTAIGAELDTLEAEEERLIVESEATDSPVQRRPDARPEIVLAV